MPLQSEGTAPYAPPSTVIDVITRYRDRGLAKPFTPEVFSRAGVPESLIPRTLQTFRLLELIDESGFPTGEFEDLARASQTEFRDRFAAKLRAVYSEVFAFADPATDDPDRIRDAFRSFNPRGQQERMVTLFLGLCEFAGIIEQIPKRQPGPRRSEPRAGRGLSSKKAGRTPRGSSRKANTSIDLDDSGTTDRMLPMLGSLIRELPEPGTALTAQQRDRYITLFGTLLDFYFPVQEVVDSSRLEESEPQEA